MSYTLLIKRYGTYLSFDNIEDLKSELKRYFTPNEISGGIVDRLTTFNEGKRQDGFIKNDYQDFTVCCY